LTCLSYFSCTALKRVQAERPSYAQGHEAWWGEVIRRTAVGAGAPSEAVEDALPEIVPRLLKRFSSKDGYRLFDDALPTLKKCRELGMKTGLVSNADSRMLEVLADLDALDHLDPVLISEAEGVEKPDAAMFERACARAGVLPAEALHIGDELECDYYGAEKAGLTGLLLRRSGPEGEAEHKEEDEDLRGRGVKTVASLSDGLQWAINTKNA